MSGVSRVSLGCISVLLDSGQQWLVDGPWIVHRSVGRHHTADQRFVVSHEYTGWSVVPTPMMAGAALRLAKTLADRVPLFTSAPSEEALAAIREIVEAVGVVPFRGRAA